MLLTNIFPKYYRIVTNACSYCAVDVNVQTYKQEKALLGDKTLLLKMDFYSPVKAALWQWQKKNSKLTAAISWPQKPPNNRKTEINFKESA